ncbi:TRAP transporter substrate-binding protein [Pseudovibrio sp. Alg231-02]|uniref:TRAP transporter substrate-binding protein n=1 Tax=Pseudovibrio sp. Alg231-02 TaxID=1922223 RepID=UPI000D5541B9|nr:TRAP transporter substrate-binding protein [Pseudovibrio sp. Alg231-02]
MFTRKIAKATVLGAALLATTSFGYAKTLKLSHNQGPEHPLHISMQHMADKVAEATGGSLKIRIYGNGALGTQRESMELVQEGTLAMAKTNASELEAFEESYSALNLPYIFVDENHYFDVLSGPIGDDILAASADKGFIGLTFYVEGARSFYANKEIHSPADLKGMKIRVQPSPSAIRMVELLGGSPTPISWGELYSALQQGVVDGAENNPLALTTARHGEVSKVYSDDGHTMIPSIVVISTTVWNSLNTDEQTAIRDAAKSSMHFHRAQWNEMTKKHIEQAKSELNVKFIEVDKAPFIEAVLPMHAEAAEKSERVGSLITRIKALTQ